MRLRRVVSQMHNETLAKPGDGEVLLEKLLYLILIYDDHSLWISFLLVVGRKKDDDVVGRWRFRWEAVESRVYRSMQYDSPNIIDSESRELKINWKPSLYMYWSSASAYIHGRKACNFKASRNIQKKARKNESWLQHLIKLTLFTVRIFCASISTSPLTDQQFLFSARDFFTVQLFCCFVSHTISNALHFIRWNDRSCSQKQLAVCTKHIYGCTAKYPHWFYWRVCLQLTRWLATYCLSQWKVKHLIPLIYSNLASHLDKRRRRDAHSQFRTKPSSSSLQFFFLHFTLQFIKFRWKRFKWKWICFGLEWDENVEQLDKIFQLIELRILLVHTKRNIRGSESRVLSLIISFWSWNRLNINVPLLSKSSHHYHHPNEPDCVFHFHFICFYVVFLFCDTCCCIWIDWTDNIDIVDDRRPTRDDGILNNNIKTTK